MTHKWMLGTALAAIVAASPAMAQSDFGPCAIDQMSNDQFMGLDLDQDDGLTRDAYHACLNEAGITLTDAEKQRYDAMFDEADGDADGRLVIAEVTAYSDASAGSRDTANAEGDAPKGTITVTQPAADIRVTEPAPEVDVTQAEPTVNVEQKQPEVSVETAEPQVAVTQPEPEVKVEQPQPTVAVSQPEPEVNVSQAQPQVSVDEGQPAVRVESEKPEVAVSTPEPDVTVKQPELDVAVQQEEPNVSVAQQSPDVDVAKTGAAEVETAAATAETDRTETAASSVEAEAIKTTSYQINVVELEGADVMNTAGEEIGEVDGVLLDPATNAPVVIISVGGVLGIGDKEVAFPYDELTIIGDEVVLNTAMTEDEIEEMPEYDSNAYQELPATMIVQ